MQTKTKERIELPMSKIDMSAEKLDAMMTIASLPIKDSLNEINALEVERETILATVKPQLDALDERYKPIVEDLTVPMETYAQAVETLGFDPLGFLAEFKRIAGIKTERKRRPEDRKAIVDFLTDNPGSTVQDVLDGAGVDDLAYVRGVLGNLVNAKKAVSSGERGKTGYTLV